ncbi:hypothetical protein B9Z19DRAFT_1128582 [Tuber borchii]|uniref:Uncharacterized protein n=1 Tax=Tuber borchii TaxID=42251 RepID=A0A2T6ZNX6_TUBBO|nr:hypothetical protein B9Z19DRAFT_1128582 [Tuber borchii]
MPKHIVKSRLEELEETVKDLSREVQRTTSENLGLHNRIEKTDYYLSGLLISYKSMAKLMTALEGRCIALEERCSALTQELSLQSLHLNAPGIIGEEEEKSLNNFIGELLQIQLGASHIANPPEPVQSEFTATMEVHEALQLGPTGRKRKVQEMAKSGPGTATPVSSSYGPIMFRNTFSDEVPTKRPTRDPARRAGRPKVGVQQLMTPPEEPAQEHQVHEEDILVTEEQHTEAVSILFENSSETFEFRSDDYDYDLFRPGNWV